MLIEIKYKLVNKNEISQLILKPIEYFDLNIQNIYKFDDTPKHLLIEDYLCIGKSKINYMKLSVIDNHNYLYNEVNFWDDGKMSSINYKEYNYEANYVFQFFKLVKEYIEEDKLFIEYKNFYKNEYDILELRSHIITDEEGSIIKEIKKTNVEKFEVMGKFKIY